MSKERLRKVKLEMAIESMDAAIQLARAMLVAPSVAHDLADIPAIAVHTLDKLDVIEVSSNNIAIVRTD